MTNAPSIIGPPSTVQHHAGPTDPALTHVGVELHRFHERNSLSMIELSSVERSTARDSEFAILLVSTIFIGPAI